MLNTVNARAMNVPIPQIDLKDLTLSIGVDDWASEEFVVYEGPIPSPRWYTPVRQDFYPFFCMESGIIRNSVDLQHYELRKDDLFFIRPWQIVQMEYVSPDARGRLVAFEPTFLVNQTGHLLEKLSFLSPMAGPVISLSAGEADMIRGMIRDIRQKVEDHQRPHRRLIAVTSVSSLLLEIDSIYLARHREGEKPLSRKQELTNHFLNLVSLHFLRERTVQFYSDLLNITPKYLTQITKALTGKTAGELIDDRVVLEAKVMLTDPELPIKLIAERLNFSDQFFFSKYFKNFTGLSPREYRNSVIR